jgi:hypothetical protein
MSPPKYIFVGGVLKLNPAYVSSDGTNASSVANPGESLAIVSSMDDIMQATEASTSEGSQIEGSVIHSQPTMQFVRIYDCSNVGYTRARFFEQVWRSNMRGWWCVA